MHNDAARISSPQQSDRSARRDEQGAVAIIVALLTAVFVGLLAIVVDLAMVRSERSEAQGAADNAAQAAAWAECQGDTDGEASAAGSDVAAENGYPGADIDRVGDRWRATIDSAVSPAFSPIITGGGNLETSVVAEARSSCRPATPLPALFAGSTTCGDKTFKLSGSNSTINGDIHSNDDITFGGTNTVNGEGSYAGTPKDANKITWNPNSNNPQHDPDPRDWPVSYQISDYSTAGPHKFVTNQLITESWLSSNGHYSSGVIEAGVYYSTKGVDLGSMQGATGTVTFVTPKQIKISPSNVHLTPYADGLLLFSDYSEPGKCDDWGIDISGSDTDWEGVIYAPKALVKYAGSNGSTLSGSIVADTLELSGSNWTLTSAESTEPGDVTVLLMK